MVKVSVIYHSKMGHTEKLAQAILKGAESVEEIEAKMFKVNEIVDDWDFINESDAIIFGSPTYMGTISAEFKEFMDKTSKIWMKQQWKDKIAAGFTNSGWPSGDKLNTLLQIAIFAAQHGMIWTSLGLMPGDLTRIEDEKDMNLVGSFLGSMSISKFNEPATVAPHEGDLKTGEYLGKRVANIALVFAKGKQI